MRKRIIRPALAVASVLVVGAGCSLGDGGPRPGVAADVDGDILTIDDVDGTVRDYCEVYDAFEGEGANPIAIAPLRSYLVHSWVQAAAVEAILDERDLPELVEPSDTDVETYWAQLGELDDDTLDGFRVIYEIQQALNQGVPAIGEDALSEAGSTEPPTEEDVFEAGRMEIEAWLAENDVEVNPVFGEVEGTDLDSLDVAAGDLSVSVSGPAALAAGAMALDSAPEDVLALPESQRCGPDELPAPAPMPPA